MREPNGKKQPKTREGIQARTSGLCGISLCAQLALPAGFIPHVPAVDHADGMAVSQQPDSCSDQGGCLTLHNAPTR